MIISGFPGLLKSCFRTFVYLESHDWLGCWGHHMKSPGFKALGEHQKVKNCRYTNHPNFIPQEDFTREGKRIKLSFRSSVQNSIYRGCVGVSFVLVEPLPRNFPDWQEGPSVEEPVQDAGSLWQTRVQLFPPDVHPSSGYQAAPQGLGGQWLQAEMDHQTCMFCFQLPFQVNISFGLIGCKQISINAELMTLTSRFKLLCISTYLEDASYVL